MLDVCRRPPPGNNDAQLGALRTQLTTPDTPAAMLTKLDNLDAALVGIGTMQNPATNPTANPFLSECRGKLCSAYRQACHMLLNTWGWLKTWACTHRGMLASCSIRPRPQAQQGESVAAGAVRQLHPLLPHASEYGGHKYQTPVLLPSCSPSLHMYQVPCAACVTSTTMLHCVPCPAEVKNAADAVVTLATQIKTTMIPSIATRLNTVNSLVSSAGVRPPGPECNVGYGGGCRVCCADGMLFHGMAICCMIYPTSHAFT